MEQALVTTLRPARPYDLRLSAGGTAGGTRRWQGAVLALALMSPAGPARAAVRQRHGGDLEAAVRATDPEAALDALRFALAVDVDHAPFLRMARRDPRMAAVGVRRNGYRPARRGSVAQSVIAAACGQLVTGGEAARMERAIVAMASPRLDDGLRLPPTSEALAGLAPARAASCGLAARRAGAMTRLARGMDVERLHAASTDQMTARLVREPWLGPWSAGMVGTYGLGRMDAPVIGDLGLMRIVAAETGRWPEPDETRALVDHYGAWSGLASAYLLMHPLARVARPARAHRAA
jgi:AraC family transcriptional regulator of adaptative response / DNA-3-methyladenine glycosylase II